jgi:hypothetical protein
MFKILSAFPCSLAPQSASKQHPKASIFAIKTIWFCEEIFKQNVQLHKIDTVEQLGDIFTKGLTHVVFEYLWKKIMG